jgi:hypothetical protein
MKKLKAFFEWIPIIGALPMLFAGRREREKYFDYSDTWFQWHLYSEAIALGAILVFIIRLYYKVLH